MIRTIAVGAVVVLAVLGLTAPAAAESEHYVALGDSYSSGLGAGDYSGGSCGRSANAYPALWAGRHEVSVFAFVACSGATTQDVIAGQASVLDAHTTLATITVGGNDAGFADVMIQCSLGSDQACVDRVEQAKEFTRAELPDRLAATYAALRSEGPNAEIVVLGYPRIFELGPCWAGLSETKRRAVNSGADTLAEVTAKSAADAGVTFVDVRDAFAGHAVCSPDPWLHGLTLLLPESYHPNRSGQALGYLPALESVT